MHGKGKLFVGFNPAMSRSAIKAKGKQIRDLHLNRCSGLELSDLAQDVKSSGSRADRLLRGALPLRAVSHRVTHRSALASMGDAEVPTTAGQDLVDLGVVGGCSSAPTHALAHWYLA